MAPTKRPGRARSKAPRVGGSRKREHQHPELIGLGLTALGLFLAVVLWLGWDGGVVGEKVGDALRFLVGRAVVLVPGGLLAVGGLLVARSRLIDLRPFQTGLGVLGLAVLLAFGGDRFGLGPGGGAPKALDADMVDGHGGVLGAMLYIVFEKLLGEAGFTILTVLALVIRSPARDRGLGRGASAPVGACGPACRTPHGPRGAPFGRGDPGGHGRAAYALQADGRRWTSSATTGMSSRRPDGARDGCASRFWSTSSRTSRELAFRDEPESLHAGDAVRTAASSGLTTACPTGPCCAGRGRAAASRRRPPSARPRRSSRPWRTSGSRRRSSARSPGRA